MFKNCSNGNREPMLFTTAYEKSDNAVILKICSENVQKTAQMGIRSLF